MSARPLTEIEQQHLLAVLEKVKTRPEKAPPPVTAEEARRENPEGVAKLTDVQKVLIEELQGDIPESNPLFQEWQTFKRHLPRLLEEGFSGKWVLIKGEDVVGVWRTRDDAIQAGYERFGGGPMFVLQVLIFQKPIRAGGWWRCRR